MKKLMTVLAMLEVLCVSSFIHQFRTPQILGFNAVPKNRIAYAATSPAVEDSQQEMIQVGSKLPFDVKVQVLKENETGEVINEVRSVNFSNV
jgi:hypothetical protein